MSALGRKQALPEPVALVFPQRRRIHRQVKQRDVVGHGAVEDGRHDVRRQHRQVDPPADVAVVDPFPGGDLLKGLGLARLQHGQPAVTPGQCQLQRRGSRVPRPGLDRWSIGSVTSLRPLRRLIWIGTDKVSRPSLALMTSGSPVLWIRISLMPMPPRAGPCQQAAVHRSSGVATDVGQAATWLPDDGVQGGF